MPYLAPSNALLLDLFLFQLTVMPSALSVWTVRLAAALSCSVLGSNVCFHDFTVIHGSYQRLHVSVMMLHMLRGLMLLLLVLLNFSQILHALVQSQPGRHR